MKSITITQIFYQLMCTITPSECQARHDRPNQDQPSKSKEKTIYNAEEKICVIVWIPTKHDCVFHFHSCPYKFWGKLTTYKFQLQRNLIYSAIFPISIAATHFSHLPNKEKLNLCYMLLAIMSNFYNCHPVVTFALRGFPGCCSWLASVWVMEFSLQENLEQTFETPFFFKILWKVSMHPSNWSLFDLAFFFYLA